jgi:hypothetical protein
MGSTTLALTPEGDVRSLNISFSAACLDHFQAYSSNKFQLWHRRKATQIASIKFHALA